MTNKFANRSISILYRYGQRFFAQELKRRGLSLEVGQMPALIRICRNPGITQEGISANTGMDKGTTARSVKQLEESKLITRCTDKMDRRLNHIYPTKAAEDIYVVLMDIIKDYHALLYEGFSEKEIELAFDLLTRMKENVAKNFCRL